MNKKTQIIILLSIFSIIVLFLSITSISPNVSSFYEKLFNVADISANEGLNLFLQPFTGMVSFFVILLSIAASVLFTIIFVLVFPFIASRNLSPDDGNLIYYTGSKVRLFCIIVMILVVIIGSIYTNPFLAILVMLVYTLPMYIAYYVSNRILLGYIIKKLRRNQEFGWADEISEQNMFENRHGEKERYKAMGYKQNRNHRDSKYHRSNYR